VNKTVLHKNSQSRYVMITTIRQITISIVFSALCGAYGPQSVAQGDTEDYTDSKITVCPVHNVTLTKIFLPVTYGLVRGPSDHPEMKREERFPYSYERILGGGVVSKDSPKSAWIHRCSECCRLALEWSAKHPRDPAPVHERPVAPSNQKDLARIIAKEAEQAGTGQPATRSQSKSEGGDKPQPEAEGRSR
jgi:hypothetical protein